MSGRKNIFYHIYMICVTGTHCKSQTTERSLHEVKGKQPEDK